MSDEQYFSATCVNCKNGEREWIATANIRIPFCKLCSEKMIGAQKCLICEKFADGKKNICVECEKNIDTDLKNFDICNSCHAFKKADRKHKICKKCFSIFKKYKICVACLHPLFHPHTVSGTKNEICERCYIMFNPVCQECCAETCLKGKKIGERCDELSQK
jgi:hypothetical protein